jgi:hypothetical protein
MQPAWIAAALAAVTLAVFSPVVRFDLHTFYDQA